MPESTILQRPSWLTTLGWAAYLACSWTWCIGMFLPVLLVRDFGLWGFVVFAVPNVIGAAAMGWVLPSRAASEAAVERNRPALEWFSRVTIVFQLFFALWVSYWFRERSLAYAAVVMASVALGVGTYHLHRGPTRLILSVGVWLFSAAAFAICASSWTAPAPPPPLLTESHLLWLAPVVGFGFLLCPYLDLTFHRARQSLPGRHGSLAFTVGFGLLFPVMIGFTLWYAGLVSFDGNTITPVTAAWLLILPHLLLQLLFTTAAHSEPRPRSGRSRPTRDWIIFVASVGVAALGLPLLFRLAPVYAGLSLGEVIYRLFMAFYGLVFPAYVWLLMIPTRDGHSGLAGPSGRRKLLIWAFAVGVAAPMFWMGFIERQTWWLAPGLGAVLAARLFLPRRPLPAR